mmetsp:Transcript_38292/g.83216  ORF Transcript_38292/g.83216 Transcript_38292/m.83216 type:complete len:243 (+) Transcript_38292:125-853(+)
MMKPFTFSLVICLVLFLPLADAFVTRRDGRVSVRKTNEATPPCSGGIAGANSRSTSLSMTGQPPPDMSRLQYDVTYIQGPQDFLDFLARDDRLCIVFVRANWCQICKAFSVKWRKMANLYGDKYDPSTGQLVIPGYVRFAEIEFTEQEDLCRRLKASRLPHVLIYRGQAGMAGKIVQYQCGPSAFGLVEESVEYLLAGPPMGIQPPWVEFVAAQEAMLAEKEAAEQQQQQQQQQQQNGGQQY